MRTDVPRVEYLTLPGITMVEALDMLQGARVPQAGVYSRGLSDINAVANERLWLPNVSPHWTFALYGLFAIVCVIAAAILAVHQPSLGVAWRADGAKRGLVAEIKSKNISLTTGDEIVAIKQPGGAPIALTRDVILEDPDIHAHYSDFNRFFETQGRWCTNSNC